MKETKLIPAQTTSVAAAMEMVNIVAGIAVRATPWLYLFVDTLRKDAQQ